MPTPTTHDPKRRTVIHGKRGETLKPCMASPHCQNLVGKRHVDVNGFAMCPSCAEDYDGWLESADLDGHEVASYREDPEGRPSGSTEQI